MNHGNVYRAPGGIILVVMFLFSFARVQAADAVGFECDSAVARVLEFNVPVEVNRAEPALVSPGMRLAETDTLTIAEEAYITVLLSDGTIARIVGPATITLSSAQDRSRQNVVARLSSALLSVLFSRDEEREDAIMGAREPKDADSLRPRFPHLIYPPRGCHLTALPALLRWQPIDEGAMYTVSLFDAKELLWQVETGEASVGLPMTGNPLRPGNVFWWQVEVQSGDTIRGSRQAAFYVLGENELVELQRYLAEIDSLVVDPRLGQMLKVSLYRDLGLVMECYREVQSILKVFPGDYAASLIEAELFEKTELLAAAAEAHEVNVGQ